ncbi:rRNA maturation RNase YbeY [Glaciecola sp. SC05]|uniref:rRNA maturation RNase YbeY n=1 Tax=Glaciecola sp. SC05 TaxID=1987355 RepID=UPI003527A809
MNNLRVDLHFDVADDLTDTLLDTIPSQEQVEDWLKVTLDQIKYSKPIELSIRSVSIEESNQLNLTYRNKDSATNVLSFPADIPEFVESNHIGDIAICAQVLCDEAKAQNKAIENHWAHLCVHGLLHLLGYDHITEQDAAEMEAIEIATLSALSIDDPYQVR